MESIFLTIFVSLALAYLLAESFKKLGLPRVVGQLFAGLILGTGVIKSLLFGGKSIEIFYFLANLGIILLFYYAGLKTNFQSFAKNFKKSVLISILNTFIPLVLGFIVMKFVFHFDNIISLIISIPLSVSAHAVSVDLLEELKMFKSRIGKIIISAGAVDDIIELVMITVVLSIFHVKISNVSLLKLFYDMILFVLIIIFARLVIVPYTLRFFDLQKTSTARFTGAILLLLMMAVLAEILAVGTIIGALVAGMIIRQTIFKETKIPNWEEHDISNSLHIIAFGFFIPLFFVWVGVNVNTALIVQNIPLITVLVTLATVGTIGGTILAVVLSKGTLKEGWLLGFGLNPKGDVDVVIAMLALTAGIISEHLFTSLVIMSLITTIVSPVIFKRLMLRYSVTGK